MNYKVINTYDNRDFWLGTVVKYPQGYRFLSRIASRGNGRKYHDSAEAAVPAKLGSEWRLEPTTLLPLRA